MQRLITVRLTEAEILALKMAANRFLETTEQTPGTMRLAAEVADCAADKLYAVFKLDEIARKQRGEV